MKQFTASKDQEVLHPKGSRTAILSLEKMEVGYHPKYILTELPTVIGSVYNWDNLFTSERTQCRVQRR